MLLIKSKGCPMSKIFFSKLVQFTLGVFLIFSSSWGMEFDQSDVSTYTSSNIPDSINCPIVCKVQQASNGKKLIIDTYLTYYNVDLDNTNIRNQLYGMTSILCGWMYSRVSSYFNGATYIHPDFLFSILLVASDISIVESAEIQISNSLDHWDKLRQYAVNMIEQDLKAEFGYGERHRIKHQICFKILPGAQEKQVNPNIPKDILFVCDKDAFERILWNRIGNSLKNKGISQIILSSFTGTNVQLNVSEEFNASFERFISDIVPMFEKKDIRFYDSLGLISDRRRNPLVKRFMILTNNYSHEKIDQIDQALLGKKSSN